MNVGKTLFAQCVGVRAVDQLLAHRAALLGQLECGTFSCAEQFRAMAFAQLTWRESLRGIEVSLSANAPNSMRWVVGALAASRSTPTAVCMAMSWRNATTAFARFCIRGTEESRLNRAAAAALTPQTAPTARSAA